MVWSINLAIVINLIGVAKLEKLSWSLKLILGWLAVDT
jgi:hypothetical protein